MKRTFFIFFIAAAILVSIAFPIGSVDKEDSVSYVAFGDSIAAGYGLPSKSDAYPSILAKDLGFSLHNWARNGQTSNGLLNQIIALSRGEKETLSQAKLITISIGGNDLIGEENAPRVLTNALVAILSGNYTLSPYMLTVYETLKSNLKKSISAIRDINPDATIFLQTLYNPYSTPGYTYNGYDIGFQLHFYISHINTIFQEVLEEIGGFYIAETAEALNGVSEYFYNNFDFHPTASGHIAIAEVIKEAYQNIPKEPPTVITETTTLFESTTLSKQETTQTDSLSTTSATLALTTEENEAVSTTEPIISSRPSQTTIITFSLFSIVAIMLFIGGLIYWKRRM